MKIDKDAVIDGLKNPLTWRGLAIVAGVFGISVSPEAIQQAGLVVAAGLGLWDTLRGLAGK